MTDTLDEDTLRYRWFGAFYILLVFVLIPLALLALSSRPRTGAAGLC